MKATRKLTALLAVLGLLMTLWVPVTAAADTGVATAASQEELLYFGRSILEKMDNGRALCYAYDRLVDGLQNQRDTIDISHRTYTINWDEAEIVYQLIRADHPELYGVQSVGYTGSGSVVTTYYGYYDAEALAYTAMVNQRVAQLTAGLEKKSDYEKSLILHDRLCDAVVYEFSEHNQTVVGSLALGASVCAGYAHGYQMLMQAVGIPCFYVVGHSRDQSHAWNLVQLDGQWYYTDVTWDDQNDDGGDIYYSYLNVTYEQISEDHTAENFAEYLPRSTATANNYYVKNGLVLDPDQPLDVKKLAKAFKENYPPQLCYLGDDAYEGAMLIFRNLDKIVYEMMGANYNYSANAGLLGHGLVIYLVIDHPHNYETETVAPSCLVGGTVTNRCSDCGYTTKETLPATGHDLTKAWHDDTHHGAQCSHCGLTDNLEEHTYLQDGITCDTCGYVSDTCTHRYDVITTYPTCTLEGQVVNVCLHCGERETVEVLPATGHDFSDVWQDDTYHGAMCAGCGMTDALQEHTYKQDGIHCDTCGYTAKACHHQYLNPCGRFCVFCGEERLIDVAHTYDDDKDADCNICGEERDIVFVTPGDANGDGKVNNRDLGMLQKFLNDQDVSVDLTAADINGDGRVNNRDLGLLQRQLNE